MTRAIYVLGFKNKKCLQTFRTEYSKKKGILEIQEYIWENIGTYPGEIIYSVVD
jgi:hypothetical protein